MACQLIELEIEIEKQIEIINNIIFQSIKHGADCGGSYDSNEENLFNAVNAYLEFNNLREDYYIDKIKINLEKELWLNIPQIINKNNKPLEGRYIMKEYIDRVELNKTFDTVCSNEVLRGQIGQYIDSAVAENVKEIIDAEWEMVIDDFDNGYGDMEYPHCSNCHRGVYRHDAGSWCTFCGASMKNPMVH